MPVLHQKGIVFLLILALWSGSHAQQPSSAPGPQKDFSDEAFIIQNRVERLNFENDGTGTRELTLRVKVQSEAGLQRYGVLQLRYARRTETLEIVFVKVRKPDGAEISTPLESVQEMPSQISREAPFYSDTREKHLPVKGLSVGDVVELKCIWRQTEPLAPGQFWTSVQFERDDIVLSETIQISVPRERAVIVKSPELPPKVSEEGPRRVYTWQRANLERQAPSKLEQAQRVARGRQPLPDILLTSFKSWDEVARWFHELLEERVRPTKEIQEKAAELTRGAADEPAKIQAIYRFVSEEFRYIGVAFGVGRYQPHFAAEVLSNQYGDCKDKHTLLAALLAAAGVNAAPVLINSSRMVDPEVPLPGQFDHLITAVLQKENILWLDSTAEVAPPGYLFALLRDKPALVLTGNKASFATTPVDPPFPSRYVYTMDARLDDTGTLEAKVEQSLRSDEEMLVRGAFRRLPRTQWKDLVQQISYATGFAGEVSDVVVSGLERTDVPLVFSYRYKRKDYPDWKGRRISAPLPLMLMTPAEEGGELPGTFWMGALGEYRFEAKIELPAGWTPELPDKKEFSTASVDFRAEYAFAEGKLTVRCLLKLKQREVHGAAVKEYKSFVEKVTLVREQFIPLTSGEAETAESVLSRMQRRILQLPDSSNPEAMEADRKARTAIQGGSVQGAIDNFKRAVTLDPKFTRDWVLLAQLYGMTMQRDASLDAYRKAIESDPQQDLPYKLLAFALMSMARRAEAIQVWQDLAKVHPDDGDVATNMGSLLFAEKRYREAIPFLETAVKKYPRSIPSLTYLALSYLQVDEDEKGEQALSELFRLGSSAQAKNNLAYQLAELNERLDAALRLAQEAVREVEEKSRAVRLDALTREDLQHTRSLAAYWDTLGWVHFRHGNLKEAESYLAASWSVMQDPVIGNHLGQVLEKMQRKQDAMRIYALASGQVSSSPDATEAKNDAQKRLDKLKGSPSPRRPGVIGNAAAGRTIYDERTIPLPRLVPGQASAEFFILFAPGSKVEGIKFISGANELKSAEKTLAAAKFKIAFPEGSTARILRRGILGCYPYSGCTFVLIPVEVVSSVE